MAERIIIFALYQAIPPRRKMASDVYTLGKEIYRYILPSLMRHYGKFVAIEPKSKEYFIGNTIAEAIAKAKARFPDREFYVAKIGSPEGVIEKWKR